MSSIRNATANDLPELVRLLGILFRIEADFTVEPQRQAAGLQMMLAQPELTPIWVAVAEDQILGMCSLQTLISTAEGTRVGLIEDVVIDPAHRGHGHGRQLLEHALAWARANGLTRLQLLCDRSNASALQFYSRNGWQSTQLICLRQMLARA